MPDFLQTIRTTEFLNFHFKNSVQYPFTSSRHKYFLRQRIIGFFVNKLFHIVIYVCRWVVIIHDYSKHFLDYVRRTPETF